MRASVFSLGAVVGAMVALASPRAEAQHLDVRAWLDRPGVKLLAVELYATWCKPCMAAVPKWKELHEKYRREGLRLVVVATQDPEAGCVNPGWNPDEVICDDDGSLARALGAGERLPSAFLWSWQGNLLVRKGHVEEVDDAIQNWMRSAPRVEVNVKGVDKGAGLDAVALRDLVRNEIQRDAKMTVVATEEERKALEALKAKSFDAKFDSSYQCEVGKDLSPNSLLDARISGKPKRQRLQLTLLSAERGCLVSSAVVDWNPDNPSGSVAEGIAEMSQKLRPQIQMPRGGGGSEGPTTTQPRPTRKPGEDEVIGEDVVEWKPEEVGERVIVNFRSEPAGAVVMMNGELLCQSTQSGCSRAVAKGRHAVTMQMERYFKRAETIEVSGAMTLEWKLEPKFGWIEVVSNPPGLEVKVDGKPVGKSPVEKFEMDPGRHEVLVSDRCYFDKGIRTEIEAGKDKKIELELTPREGALDVTATDKKGNQLALDIFVDGEKKGRSPAVLRMSICASSVELRDKDGLTLFTKAPEVVERKTVRFDAVIDLGGGRTDRNHVVLFADGKYTDYRSGISDSEGWGMHKLFESQGRKVQTITSLAGSELRTALERSGVLVIPDLETNAPSVDSSGYSEIRKFVDDGGAFVVAMDDADKARVFDIVNRAFGTSLRAVADAKGTISLDRGIASSIGFSGPATLTANNDTDMVDATSIPAGSHPIYTDAQGNAAIVVIPSGKGWVGVIGYDWYDGKPAGKQDGGWVDAMRSLLNLGSINRSSWTPPSASSRLNAGAIKNVLLYANASFADYRSGVAESEGYGMQRAMEAAGRSVSTLTFAGLSSLQGALRGKDAFVWPDLEKGDPKLTSGELAEIKRFVSAGGALIVAQDDGTKAYVLQMINQAFGYRLEPVSDPSGSIRLNTTAAGAIGFSGPSTLNKNNDTDAVKKSSIPSGAHKLYEDSDGNGVIVVIPYGKGWISILGWDWWDGKPAGKQDGGWVPAFNGLLNLGGSVASSGSAAAEAPSVPTGGGSISVGPRNRIAMLADTKLVDYRTTASDSEGHGIKRAMEGAGASVSTLFPFSGSALRSGLSGKGLFVIPDLENGEPKMDSSMQNDLRSYVADGGAILGVMDDSSKTYLLKMYNSIFGWSMKGVGDPRGTMKKDSSAASALGFSGPLSVGNNNDTDLVVGTSLPPGAHALYKDDSGNGAIVVIPYGRGWVGILGWDWYDGKPAGKQDNGWTSALAGLIKLDSVPGGAGASSSGGGGARSGARPKVLLYGEAKYADYRVGTKESEGYGMKRALEASGRNVYIAYNMGNYNLKNLLKGRDAFVIPDLEKGDPKPTSAALGEIRSFVEGGGMLVVALDDVKEMRGARIINGAFGLSLRVESAPKGTIKLDSGVASSIGFDGPSTLSNNNDTDTVIKSSLPYGSKILYADSSGNAAVALIKRGSGWIVIHGWDWYDGKPAGKQDGGWVATLDGLLGIR